MVCGAWYPLADQVGACPLETYRPTFPAFPIMQNTEIFHICWQDSLLSLPSTLILTTTTTTTTYGDIQSQLKTYLLKYPMILTDSLKSCSAPFSSASAVQQCNMISPNIPFTIINIILIAVHGLNPNFNTFHSITPSLLHITKINMQHFFVNSLSDTLQLFFSLTWFQKFTIPQDDCNFIFRLHIIIASWVVVERSFHNWFLPVLCQVCPDCKATLFQHAPVQVCIQPSPSPPSGEEQQEPDAQWTVVTSLLVQRNKININN